jgi:hypothetical protein
LALLFQSPPVWQVQSLKILWYWLPHIACNRPTLAAKTALPELADSCHWPKAWQQSLFQQGESIGLD